MNWKLPAGILAAVLIIALLGWLVYTRPAKEEAPEQIIQSAEGTNIPETATSLDGYAFVDESGVYLRSAFGTSSVQIPDADPETFRVVSPITEYGSQEILDFCKGPGNYGLYADKKKAYLFQFWKTETFAKTKIEVLKGLNPDSLTVTGPQTFGDGVQNMALGYEFATTTCTFIAEPA